MRVLHAIVAFFTVMLLFIQQKYVSVCAGSWSTKESLPAWLRHSSGGSPCASTLPLLPADCVLCARASHGHEECRRPKYKRDPEIAVDNEFIGYRPNDDEPID